MQSRKICNQEKYMQSRKRYAIKKKLCNKTKRNAVNDKRQKKKDNSAFQENQAN